MHESAFPLSAAQCLDGLGKTRAKINPGESLHTSTPCNKVEVIRRARLRSVGSGYGTAQNDARLEVDAREYLVEDGPADTVDEDVEVEASLMFTVGYHLVEDMAWSFGWRSTDALVEREEFDEAVTRLKAAGYEVRPADAAWKEFVMLRAKYASTLSRTADWLAISPAKWIGDRSYLPHADGRVRGRRRKSAVVDSSA